MQPVRSADYPAHPSFARVLAVPAATAVPATTEEEARRAWADYLRWSGPLFLFANADRARRLLMTAFGVEPGERVGVPVNTRRYLAEAVKKVGGRPLFVELDADLGFEPATHGLGDVRLLWAQPVGGMAPPPALPDTTLLVDYGTTLPAPLPAPCAGEAAVLTGAATLWGLHLSAQRGEAGAVVAVSYPALAERLAALYDSIDRPDFGRALAQVRRLAGADGLAARLRTVERETRFGMEIGAGLPMAPTNPAALPFGLPLRVPAEAELATFIAYVRNELVDLDWLPEIQPMFYVGFQVTLDPALTRRSAEHLARWVISPLGPDFVDDEVTHAVLGPLKAAEYTGVRWYTNPGRARWYGDLLTGWYGVDHDAYHPAFVIAVAAKE